MSVSAQSTNHCKQPKPSRSVPEPSETLSIRSTSCKSRLISLIYATCFPLPASFDNIRAPAQLVFHRRICRLHLLIEKRSSRFYEQGRAYCQWPGPAKGTGRKMERRSRCHQSPFDRGRIGNPCLLFCCNWSCWVLCWRC